MNFNRRYRDFASTAYVNAVLIGAVPTGYRWRLTAILGYNSKATTQFLQLHDLSAAPADGVVPVLPLQLEAQKNFFIDLNDYGMRFSTGLYICNSSTATTKTIGSADCWINGTYEIE